MWSLFNINWFTSDKKTAVPPPPSCDLLPILFSNTIHCPGPGRNIPPLLDQLKKSKLNLKSPEVIKTLKEMSLVNELLFIQVIKKLKKITPIPRRTSWPCKNPLFTELRQKVLLKR